MGFQGAPERIAMTVMEMAGVSLARKIGASYDLRIAHFSIGQGENKAIVGPSGCGKSTTLDLAGLILEPDKAELFRLYPGEKPVDIAALWRQGKINALTDLRRHCLGYVLQTGELFGFLSVRENIELAAITAGKGQPGKIAGEMMERLEISHLANKKPAMLSIGERQRTAIARGLAPRPGLLLADEPTAALDPGLARKVMRLFLDTVRDYGTALVMVTHDLNLAREFGFQEVPIETEILESGINANLDDCHV